MKELWKKIDRFMLKYGGYSLLIATVATVAFFAVLQWAQDYVKEKTPELEIQLDDEGYLYVNYQYDDKENVYIFWETDGGSLSIENKDNTFSEQKEYQNFNKGYYGYTKSNERVLWSSNDADGNTYSTATVRAVLYEKDKDNIYKIENYVLEVNITLTMQDGKIIKAKDRVFSNPVRENSDDNWSQIYCIQETEDTVTYRYRTGSKIDEDKVLILYWKADDSILSETDYAEGICPSASIIKENENKSEIKASTMITCEKKMCQSGKQIMAGLMDEETYKSEQVEKKDMIYISEFVFHEG